MANREYDNHDDIELSNMIHEYASDNSLRNKIEALKKEKEEAKANQVIADEQSQIIQNENIKTNVIDDEELGKTRVVLSDTTSIPHQEDQTMVFHDFPKKEVTKEPSYEDDETVDDEDMEEFLSESSLTQEERDKKINKIITGAIIGIVSLCFIGLGVVGYQLIKGSSTNTEVASETQNDANKNNDKDKETVDQNKTENSSSKEETTEKEPVKPDNSTEIAGLRGQIKAYEEQVAERKGDLESAKIQLDSAKIELSNIEAELSTAQGEKKSLEQSGKTDKDTEAKIRELETKITSLEAKKKEAAQKESNARSLIEEINSSISDLNSKITALQGQLNKLL